MIQFFRSSIMIKVFIADDEVFVLQLIQRIIDWTALGMEIVGTANNGEAAFKEIINLVPDIVIVDVKMPGYDGITLMQKVRAVNERVRFIIISGHKRFEYAKSAMKYNVEDYILKPIDEKELENILKKLKNQIEQEDMNARQSENMVQQLDDSKKNLKQYFLEQFIKGDLQKELVCIDKVNEKYLTQFDNGIFRFVIVHLNIFEKKIDQAFLKKMIEVLFNNFTEIIEGMCHCLAGLDDETHILFLLNYSEEKDKQLIEKLRRYHEHIEGIIEKFQKLQTNICVGTPENNLYDAWCSMEIAKKCQQSRLVIGTDKIIIPNMVKSDAGLKHVIFSDKNRQNIQMAIKSLDKNKIRAQILEALAKADEYRYRDTCIFYTAADTILEYFYEYISHIDLNEKTYDDFKKEYTRQLNLCVDSKDVARIVISKISEVLDKYMGERTDNENPAVRIAKQYVAENYKKNISLSVISEIINLSSVYFSMLFKKEVGVNFLDYLNQYRIEQSKALLKDVTNNINEVADKVGFSDARYFTRVFKKYLGITPAEYRQRCAKWSGNRV
jgi:two-component system response regulator YesN